jgi:hypothetical protein
MLRVIPKHKGTDHLQGDLKRRIRELDEELAGPKRGGARSAPALVIRPEGAAQVAILGPPNSGKSTLHARLTGSNARAAPYPFTTQYPEPGMMPVEDIHLSWWTCRRSLAASRLRIGSTLQSADAAPLVGHQRPDAAAGAGRAQSERSASRHVPVRSTGPRGPDDDDPFALSLPVLLVANKATSTPTAGPTWLRSRNCSGSITRP